MNRYKELEMILDDDFLDILADEGEWENEAYAPLIFLSVTEAEEGVNYGCDIHPADESPDVAELNRVLVSKGYTADGYGWDEYLRRFVEADPFLFNKVGYDSESETCGLYVLSAGDYQLLLTLVSKAVRELLP